MNLDKFMDYVINEYSKNKAMYSKDIKQAITDSLKNDPTLKKLAKKLK